MTELVAPIEAWLDVLWSKKKAHPDRVRNHIRHYVKRKSLPPDLDAVCLLVGETFGQWKGCSDRQFKHRRHALALRVLSILLGKRWAPGQLVDIERRQ